MRDIFQVLMYFSSWHVPSSAPYFQSAHVFECVNCLLTKLKKICCLLRRPNSTYTEKLFITKHIYFSYWVFSGYIRHLTSQSLLPPTCASACGKKNHDVPRGKEWSKSLTEATCSASKAKPWLLPICGSVQYGDVDAFRLKIDWANTHFHTCLVLTSTVTA